MKANLVTAETYSHESGKITVRQTYTLDASKEFEEHTKVMSDDEIMEAAEWMDFIDIKQVNIEHELYSAIKIMDNLEWGSSVDLSWLGRHEVKTVEDAKKKVAGLELEVTAELSFSLDHEAQTKIEQALMKATTFEVPGAKPKSQK
jgi:hypothetical protein